MISPRAGIACAATAGFATGGAGLYLGYAKARSEAAKGNWGAAAYVVLALGGEALAGAAALGTGLALRTTSPVGVPLAAFGAGMLAVPAGIAAMKSV